MKRVNFRLNVNLTTLVIIIVVILAIFGGFGHQFRKINKLNNQISEEVKLRNALIDTVRVYRNQADELVYEKLTLQADLSTLKDLNESLTESQRDLLRRIEQLNRDKSVITAALIQAELIIDSLLHGGIIIIDEEGETIRFVEEENELINYDIQVNNVIPSFERDPELFIRSLKIPNETFIEFHWQLDRRADYPIAFSVTNTSPFYQVHNIESYAIPQLQKDELDPTTWQSIGQWFQRNRGVTIKIGLAGAAGYLVGRTVSN